MYRAGRMRPNLVAGGSDNPITDNPDQWFDPSQFVPSVCVTGVYCIGNTPGTPNYNPALRTNASLARPDLGYQIGYWGDIGSETAVGPGPATFDFSLNKNIPVTETMRVQFRSEFFNLFNTPNFRIPSQVTPFNSNGTRNPNAGRIDTTRTVPRQIQLALKFIF